jgi:hypothetical protein
MTCLWIAICPLARIRFVVQLASCPVTEVFTGNRNAWGCIALYDLSRSYLDFSVQPSCKKRRAVGLVLLGVGSTNSGATLGALVQPRGPQNRCPSRKNISCDAFVATLGERRGSGLCQTETNASTDTTSLRSHDKVHAAPSRNSEGNTLAYFMDNRNLYSSALGTRISIESKGSGTNREQPVMIMAGNPLRVHVIDDDRIPTASMPGGFSAHDAPPGRGLAPHSTEPQASRSVFAEGKSIGTPSERYRNGHQGSHVATGIHTGDTFRSATAPLSRDGAGLPATRPSFPMQQSWKAGPLRPAVAVHDGGDVFEWTQPDARQSIRSNQVSPVSTSAELSPPMTRVPTPIPPPDHIEWKPPSMATGSPVTTSSSPSERALDRSRGQQRVVPHSGWVSLESALRSSIVPEHLRLPRLLTEQPVRADATRTRFLVCLRVPSELDAFKIASIWRKRQGTRFCLNCGVNDAPSWHRMEDDELGLIEIGEGWLNSPTLLAPIAGSPGRRLQRAQCNACWKYSSRHGGEQRPPRLWKGSELDRLLGLRVMEAQLRLFQR